MLSPIFNLLPELLSEIFIFSVPDKNPCESEAPINVSSVCKEWHQIAVSTPYLWSKVYTQRRSDTDYARLHSVDSIKTWISRSKGRGFSFVIDLRHLEVSDKDKFNAMITVLVTNCELWRDIHISMRNEYIEGILSEIPMRTPNLRKLSIHGVSLSIANLLDAPLMHLTFLRLVSTTIHSPCRSNSILENLRSIPLEAVKYPDVFGCLSRSPRLEAVKAYFDFTSEDSRRTQDHACFKLEHLRHLDLTVGIHSCDQGLRRPFDHVDLPALKTLLIGLQSFQPM